MSSPSRSERMARTWERVRTEPGLARNTFVTVAMILVALVAGGIVLSQQRFIPPWQHRYVLYATFAATPGVSPGQGQEVRIAGVQVGQIVDASVNDAGQAVLQLSMNKELEGKVYDNAHLLLRPKSPLNEMYVIMDAGGPPGKPLQSGDVLPLGTSERPIEVDEVLDHLDDNARTMFTELLSESDVALVNAQKTLPPGLDAVRLVGNDLRPVSEELVKRKEKLRTLITALGELAKGVGHDNQRLVQLSDGLQSTLGTISSNDQNVRSTLDQLPDVLRQLRDATTKVHGLADELDPTLRNLEAASDKFPKALKALEGTSDRLDDTVQSAKDFVHEARPVANDLRPFVSDARKGTPALRDVSGSLDGITGRTVDFRKDLAAFVVQTRSIVSLTDANTGILRGILDVSAQSAPPILGRPNNGLKPIPAPALDSGTTALQKAVPTGPGGDPAMRQDGSRAPRGNRQPTPGDDGRPSTGSFPGPFKSLPFGKN